MRAEVKLITPDVAIELMKLNHSNRKIKSRIVTNYVKEMKKGNWRFTGESIKISKNNRLLDGQHRLSAVINSGVSVEMLVIYDLEDDVFNVLDTGANRSSGDVLSINRVKNPSLVAATARILIHYNAGRSVSDGIVTRPTNRDIQEYVSSNPELIEICESFTKYSYKFKLLSPAFISAMYFIFYKINVSDADKFFDKLITGLDVQLGCPIRQFRERLIRDQINKTRLTANEKIKLIVSAWNIFRKGREVKNLRVPEYHQVAI